MMDRLESVQDQFFYNFRLDDVVAPDHLVRRFNLAGRLQDVFTAAAAMGSMVWRARISVKQLTATGGGGMIKPVADGDAFRGRG